jgi:drug/metabolite transporter (DMT)-like permease
VKYSVLVVFGVIAGLRLLTYYQALLLIPLAECIVLTSTTPVFSLLATRILVGTKLKWTQVRFALRQPE